MEPSFQSSPFLWPARLYASGMRAVADVWLTGGTAYRGQVGQSAEAGEPVHWTLHAWAAAVQQMGVSHGRAPAVTCH